MPLTKRQEKILDVLVREYVDSAKPVSSKLLRKRAELDVSPATVRNEMQELAKRGYLKQPYTSGGRIPTNKAYRLFVGKLLDREEENLVFKDFSNLKKGDVFKFAEMATRILSSVSSGLALTYLLEKNLLWEDGWKDIFKNPEFEDKKFREDFAEEVKDLEKSIKDFKDEPSNIQVYIGREKSRLGSNKISMIVSKTSFSDKEKGLMIILGPSRMAYEKNIQVINYLTKLMERF